MENKMIRYRGYIQCPVWAGAREFLRECGMYADLDVDITEEKGLLQTTIFYKVEGTLRQVSIFKRLFKRGVNHYQESEVDL